MSIDRGAGTSLTEQIRSGIAAAIGSGVLQPEARLPSWQDLATQLGVARGTVRRAYSALTDSHLVTSSPTDGTRVAKHISPVAPPPPAEQPLPSGYRFYGGPSTFQMGVPARDLFPAKVFARLHARCARAEAIAPDRYPDPRGEEALRHEIAAHLAIARGIACVPAQVFVTAGYLGGLGALLRILGLHGSDAWVEEPCFPVARQALRLSGMRPVPVLVDEEGIVVDRGLELAPDARAALVTPGQQAPLGVTLSPSRRRALLKWAAQRNAWIIEDDYLGELQLRGRAAPALASVDAAGRVIHVGSFSKTISPGLRVGFLVVPPSLVATFTDAFACAGAVPGSAAQNAVAAFMREGHYLRHLRRVKRALAATGDAVRHELGQHGLVTDLAGLAAVVRLPPGSDDVAIAEEAARAGLGPAPLSPWYAEVQNTQSGLLLGIASARGAGLERSCSRVAQLIVRATKGCKTQ